MIRRTLIILLFSLSYLSSDAQGPRPPSSTSITSTFDVQPDNIGAAQHAVNLFTGDLSLPINLVTLSGIEGVAANVSLMYSSNVQNQVDIWNLDSPTGTVGLGWSLVIPKIVCDHKNTGTRQDDIFYLLENQTSNELVCTGRVTDASGTYNTYKCKKYQFWQIRFYFDPKDYGLTGTAANKWLIVRENGVKYVYGDNTSARSTIQYAVRWNNWIGNSSNTSSSSQSQIAIVWNLSEVNNLWGQKATYEYTNVEQFVGSSFGQKQTEASYLKQIVDPVGRKVQFFYNNKSSQFYMEPHTEQPEPDAYQEFYEKLYLDHVDVLQETGTKYLSVYLKYSTINDGTNTAKMLLANIEKRNSTGAAIPGIRFDYFSSTTSTGYKGFLQKITYPTGGTVSYSYAMSGNNLGHSKRDLKIIAPPTDQYNSVEYSEPNVWYGSDYVVVAWRGLILDPQGNLTDAVDDPNYVGGGTNVKLYVYQWVGEWKMQQLADIPSIHGWLYFATDPVHNATYEGGIKFLNFDVTTEDDFFSILCLTSSSNVYQPYVFFKDRSSSGKWSTYSMTTLTTSVTPTLVSGKEFIYIATVNGVGNKLLQFTGNNFISMGTTMTSASYSYGAGDNYYITQAFGTGSNDIITLNFLKEDGTWGQTTYPTTGSTAILTSDYSKWYCADTYAVLMTNGAANILRWDINYSNFTKDNGGGQVLIGDKSYYVFPINNSNVSVSGISGSSVASKSARFDGVSWVPNSNFSAAHTNMLSFGVDFYVYPSDASHYTLSSFDPNTSAWINSVKSPQNLPIFQDNGNAATISNFYAISGENFYKMPNGLWTMAATGNAIDGAGDNFLTNAMAVYFLKNGVISSSFGAFLASSYNQIIVFGDPSVPNGYFLPMVGPSTAVSFDLSADDLAGNNGYATLMFANTLYLHRVLNFGVTGTQVDYPVSSITLSGANSVDQTVSFGFHFSTAGTDPSGQIAEYAEVDVAPGNSNGYTKTYFNNSLTHSDDSNILFSGSSIDLSWLGLPYQINTYDQGNASVPVATISTTYTPTLVTLSNSTYGQIDVGYYARPTQTSRTMDGKTVTTTYTYDANSNGQVRSVSTTDGSTTTTEEYLFWQEKYDPTNLLNLNLLTPVVQVSESLNNSYTKSKITRWKNWSALNLPSPSTIPAAFDQLIWNGTNSPSFASWDTSIASSTLTDWTLLEQVNVRDNYTGTPLETMTLGGVSNSVILDQYKLRPMATISNAAYSQCAYNGFEDTSLGNWWIIGGAQTTSESKTGSYSLSINTQGLTFSGMLSTETYVISYWQKKAVANAGSLLIDGLGNIGWDDLTTTWNFYQYEVSGLTSLTMKNSSSSAIVYIDEVRIYPKRASMESTTFDLVNGPVAKMDRNNNATYFSYDSWGRLQSTSIQMVGDPYKNVVKTYSYNLKN